MTLTEILKDYEGELEFYISGSQGVASTEVYYPYHGQSEDAIALQLLECVDENAIEYIEDYLEEYSLDELEEMLENDEIEQDEYDMYIDEAHGEACTDSGNFYLIVGQHVFHYLNEFEYRGLLDDVILN